MRSVLLLCLSAGACADDPELLDPPDLGSAADVGQVEVGSSDGGRPDADPVDVGTQSEGTVEECRAAVDLVIASCSGESRACFWQVWRAQCDRGTDDVIREAAGCFEDDAAEDFCRSMGDPGTTENLACTNAALQRARTPAAEATVEALCQVCDQPDLCLPNGNGSFGAPFEFLPDEAQPALQACLGQATDCDSSFVCVAAAFEGLDACLD